MLVIGKAVKTHGLKGECKVQSLCDTPLTFQKIKKVYIKNTVYDIEKVTVSGDFVYLKIKDIDTVDDVKKIIGSEILAEKEDLPPLPDGRFYIAELLGCSVFIEDEKVGTVKDVLQYGAADVIVLKKEGKEIMFPWTDNLFEDIDTDHKKIIVNKTRFQEVAVYED